MKNKMPEEEMSEEEISKISGLIERTFKEASGFDGRKLISLENALKEAINENKPEKYSLPIYLFLAKGDPELLARSIGYHTGTINRYLLAIKEAFDEIYDAANKRDVCAIKNIISKRYSVGEN